jgi:septal ring factor EnvC (AmiA/AmiB activator)
LHNNRDYVPFEDEPDIIGDRQELKIKIGRLRRELAAAEDRIARLAAENRDLRQAATRRHWLPRRRTP